MFKPYHRTEEGYFVSGFDLILLDISERLLIVK